MELHGLRSLRSFGYTPASQGGDAPAGSAFGDHRYWRIALPSYNGATSVMLPEVALRAHAGGVNELGAGTAAGSSYWSSDSTTYAAAKTYDNDTATYWRSSPTGADVGEYVTYDAGSGNAFSVYECAITGPTSGQETSGLKSAFFAFSDDNATWQAAFGVTAQASWTALEQRTFTDPKLDIHAAHRYWAIATFDNGGTSSMILATLEFRATPGGADQCSGGTPVGDGWTNLANLFDGTSTTNASKNGVTTWAGYDFGSDKNVTEIALKVGDTYSLPAPVHFSVMCSDDGVHWSAAWSVAASAWSAGETKVFTMPGVSDTSDAGGDPATREETVPPATLPDTADAIGDFVSGDVITSGGSQTAADVLDHPEMIIPGVGLVVPMDAVLSPQFIGDFQTMLESLNFTLVMEWYRQNAVTKPIVIGSSTDNGKWFSIIDGTIQVYAGDYNNSGVGERFVNMNAYHNSNSGVVNVMAVTRTDDKISASYNGNPVVTVATSQPGLSALINQVSVGGPPSGLYDGAIALSRLVIYPPKDDSELPGLSVRTGRQKPPANDKFSKATKLTANVASSGNNWLATKESGEPNHAGNAGGHSSWWKFKAPATATYTVDLLGSQVLYENWLVGVYTGSSVSALTEVASASIDVSVETTLTFDAVAGTTYLIAVDGHTTSWGGAVCGDITIKVS